MSSLALVMKSPGLSASNLLRKLFLGATERLALSSSAIERIQLINFMIHAVPMSSTFRRTCSQEVTRSVLHSCCVTATIAEPA